MRCSKNSRHKFPFRRALYLLYRGKSNREFLMTARGDPCDPQNGKSFHSSHTSLRKSHPPFQKRRLRAAFSLQNSAVFLPHLPSNKVLPVFSSPHTSSMNI